MAQQFSFPVAAEIARAEPFMATKFPYPVDTNITGLILGQDAKVETLSWVWEIS
jgi:hypothetical protein